MVANCLLLWTAKDADSSSKTRPALVEYPNKWRGLCCRYFALDHLRPKRGNT